MPISDYLLSLALALHPAGGHAGAVPLGPDSIVQPSSAASISPRRRRGRSQGRAGSKDPRKHETVKPAFTRYKHGSGRATADAHGVKSDYTTKGQHIKSEHIKQPMVVKGNTKVEKH